MLKKIIHQDGNIISGFSSRKISQVRSYTIKSITGTLPMMKTLHDKWTLYNTEVCPRYFESTETNQYIWSCPKSMLAPCAISDALNLKYTLPSNLTLSCALLAEVSFPLPFTQFLKRR